MRRTIREAVLLAAALMMIAIPVLADEGALMPAAEPDQMGTKNECLLVSMNCGEQVDTIQQRIERIQNEIKRGTDVYTTDELRRLQNQLDDAKKNFDNLTNGA